MREKISVIMSYYNEEIKWLKESVSSVLNQTYRDLELIIIIDNPHIVDKDIIKYFEELKKEKNIILHENKKNLGLALSLNKGIALSSGEYIARMDADDISMKNRLYIEMKHLKANNSDMVFSNKEVIDEDGVVLENYKAYKFSNENIEKVLELYNCVVHPQGFYS